MKAIILAAGRGNRMEKYTVDKPKCLISFAGKPLLEWQLRNLKNAGISEIGIVKGYCADKITIPGLEYFVNPEWSTTNMVHSLLCAHKWLEKEICIISYADILYPAGIVTRLIHDTNDIAITYDRNWGQLWTKRFGNPLNDSETFRVDDQGFITEIGNRPSNINEIKGQYMGLIKITSHGYSIVNEYLKSVDPAIRRKMDMTTLFRSLISIGTMIHSVGVSEPWLEFDNPNDIEVYSTLLKEGKLDPIFR